MGWLYHTQIGPDRTLHSWPQDDSITHVTGGGTCPCLPELEDVDGLAVLVKHRDALDRLGLDYREA